MKVNLEIEQFDNGITLKWEDAEEKLDPEAIVALDRDKEAAIGKMIWDDVKSVMDSAVSCKVTMEITYQANDGKEK
jgi:hypothetical protein